MTTNPNPSLPACAADDEGRRCTREPVMLRPVPLCDPHRIEVALAVVPAVLRDQLVAAQQRPAAPEPRAELVATARVARVEELLQGVHECVVYFLANGGRVKIGYTTNLKNRLGSLALRVENVLLVLHGGPELERALHARFSSYRDGATEWFELSPEVFRFISSPRPDPSTATAVAASVAVEADSANTAFRAHVDRVRNWLAADPDLKGTEIGKRLGTSDSYGRRVRRVALNGGRP
jgi:hypothetical protein